MGRIIKYNIAKGDSIGERTKSTTFISSGGTTYSNTEGDDKKTGVDCKLWGQDFTGNDIDGTMTVYGDIYLKNPAGIDADDDEEEGGTTAPDDDDEDDEEIGVGRFEADDDIVSHKTVKGKDGEFEQDLTVGRHLYINSTHPDHNGQKKCVGELINGLDTRLTTAEGNIQTNATNISSLTQTVNNHTTQINNLSSRMDDAESDIADNADEISKLKSSNLTEDDVLALIRNNQPSKLGAYDQPVVLFSGRARRVTYFSDKYYIEGLKLPHFSLSNVIEDGLMTITITPDTGYTINVYGVHCNQERSGDSTDNIDNPWLKGRSDGAHWFESRVDALLGTKKVYIREFHQGNGDNDTWYSDNWFSDGGIKAIHLTLIGYITPPAT